MGRIFRISQKIIILKISIETNVPRKTRRYILSFWTLNIALASPVECR